MGCVFFFVFVLFLAKEGVPQSFSFVHVAVFCVYVFTNKYTQTTLCGRVEVASPRGSFGPPRRPASNLYIRKKWLERFFEGGKKTKKNKQQKKTIMTISSDATTRYDQLAAILRRASDWTAWVIQVVTSSDVPAAQRSAEWVWHGWTSRAACFRR